MSLLNAAHALAEDGWPVFPCNRDKSPRTTNGFKDATTDTGDIVQCFDWPEGTLIGVAIPEGMAVIDVDPRNGGNETLQQLVLATGETLTQTRRVRTRSGGDHWYYAVPEGTQLRATLGPGVDVKRAGKGYVIAPPSTGYEYVIEGPVAPMPQWLLDELEVKRTGRIIHGDNNEEAHAPKFMVFESGTAYGQGALVRELDRLAQAEEGGRNAALNRAAFALGALAAGGELSEGVSMEALYKAALDLGLTTGEAKATILSGWNAGSENPRQAPPTVASVVPEPVDAPDAPFKWVDWDIDEPSPPFYCHPFLPENAYVLVYGATEAAKSMAWLGLLAEGSHKGLRSSIYSLENPPATDRDRLRRWAPDPANLRLTNEPLDLFSVGHVDALVERESAWGTNVVMIDTYSHAFSSHSDDGNAKAISFARRVRYIMAQVGCSVIVIDHTGFVGNEPRDASAKRQAVDVAILMEKNGEWQHGAPAKFQMTNYKAARFGNPFYLGGEIHDVDGRKGLRLKWSGEKPSWRPL